jgi:hypothetical protein
MKKRVSPVIGALLLFCMAPFFAAAQDVEEQIETGRFGAREPTENESGDGGVSYTNRWLFLGARLGPSLRIYTPQEDTAFTGGDTYGPSMDAGFHAALLILPFFSLQAEAIFTFDRASVWFYAANPNNVDVDSHTRQFTGFSLQFPLMAKLNFYPGKVRVSPFLGVYVPVPLGQMTINDPFNGEESLAWSLSPPLGILGGLSVSFSAGPGKFFIDLRYAADLAEPELQEGRGLTTYRGHKVVISAGYEFGFFKKRQTGSAK